MLGLDRFPPGHDQGSSHGQTRIIRQAYFEHPDYVPLVLDAFELWKEIQQLGGKPLFEQTGLLQIGKPDGPVIGGVLRSAERHHLKLESLTIPRLQSRFPMFDYPTGSIGLFEPVAGFLRVEECVRTLIQLAVDSGAQFRDGQAVTRWTTNDDGTYLVITDQESFATKRLIVSAGAWAAQLLAQRLPKLRVIAKHQHWFRCNSPGLTLSGGCPTFFFETEDGYFYGFPDFDGGGNKIAEHSGGVIVSDPAKADRDLDPADLVRVNSFLARFLMARQPVHVAHSVCLYTMSPDEHFIVDTIGESGSIAVACGFSGHGFKLCR